MKKIRSTFTAPLLVLVIYLLLVLSRYIDVEALKYRGSIYLSLIILQMLIFILPGVFYGSLRGKGLQKKIKKKKPGLRDIWFIFTAFGVMLFGSTLINFVSYSLIKTETQYSLYNTFSPGSTGTVSGIAYIVIAFAILPAITEEYVFRGIILSEYSEYGVFTAILMSSLMFAMLHFNLTQFVSYFFCGAVAAYTVYVTQSIYAGMLLHFVNNIYAIFFETFLWDVIQSPNSVVFFLFAAITAFLFFLGLSFSSAERITQMSGLKGEKPPDEAVKREGGIRLVFESLASPSFLACVIVYVVVILVL